MSEPDGRDPESGQFQKGHSLGAEPGNTRALKYDPDFHPALARKVAKLGGTNVEIADALGICPSTMTNWRNTYPEFVEALKLGGEQCLDRAETSIYARAVGYDYTEEQAIKVKVGKDVEKVDIVEVRRHLPADPNAAVRLLAAKGREEWRERRDVNLNGQIVHVSVEQARRDLMKWLAEEQAMLEAPVIDGQAVEIERAEVSPGPS